MLAFGNLNLTHTASDLLEVANIGTFSKVIPLHDWLLPQSQVGVQLATPIIKNFQASAPGNQSNQPFTT